MNKKRHRASASELLFKRMVASTTRACLLIFLYLLWHGYSWTVEGLEGFVDGFWDYIEACNSGKDEDVNGLVNQFTVETGIDPGLFHGEELTFNGAIVRKNALMIAQLFLWSVGDWERDELLVYGETCKTLFKAYDKGDKELLKGINQMQEETGLRVEIH